MKGLLTVVRRRLDIELVRRGLADSREAAQAMIATRTLPMAAMRPRLILATGFSARGADGAPTLKRAGRGGNGASSGASVCGSGLPGGVWVFPASTGCCWACGGADATGFGGVTAGTGAAGWGDVTAGAAAADWGGAADFGASSASSLAMA